MNLHRALQPDWEGIPRNEQTLLQRIADKTNGYATAGNLITVAGAGLFLAGLRDFRHEQYFRGSLEVAAALLCDGLDGWVADQTGTKSPKGEVLDAAVDKLEIGLAVPVLHSLDAISSRQTQLLVVQNGANAFVAGIARLSDVQLHPSRAGKITRAVQSISLVAGTLSAAAEKNGLDLTARSARRVNQAAAVGALITGACATLGYVRDLSKSFGSPDVRGSATYAHDQ